VPFLDYNIEIRKIICSTDEIVKIVLGRRSADHPVPVRLLASRGSSTAGHLCRSAAAVKMQRPTGRTILTAASTGASSKLEEPRPTAEMRSANRCSAATRLAGLPVGDEDLVGTLGLFGDLFFFAASLLVVVGGAGDAMVTATGGGAGSQLEPAPLVLTRLGRANA
jgi:hypothetical protein